MENGEEPLERLIKTGLLYDFYGGLLTEKQRQAIELYYLENWSLAEIAAKENVSRQAVHDLLHRSERIMLEFEAKLGLLERFKVQQTALAEISIKLNDILKKMTAESPLHRELTALNAKVAELIDNQ